MPTLSKDGLMGKLCCRWLGMWVVCYSEGLGFRGGGSVKYVELVKQRFRV